MDREARPVPERVVELSRYAPAFLRGCLELQEIYDIEDENFRELYGRFDGLWAVSLIKEADLSGIKRYEKLLGIASDSRLLLEDRRARVLMMWNRQLPYTLRRLAEQLALWSGDESFTVDISRFDKYELRIELYNQTLIALRDIKRAVEAMLPVNLLLFLIGRYPGEFDVPVRCENAVRFSTAFYPRFNLGFLYLDDTWTLDNTCELSGYDGSDYLDFYPVQVRISAGGAVLRNEAASGLCIQSGVPAEVKAGEQLRLSQEVRAPAVAGGRLRVLSTVQVTAETTEGLRMGTGAAEQVQTSGRLCITGAAAVQVETGAQIRVQGAAALNLGTASFMTREEYLDGSNLLDGSRLLNGGRYIL